MSPQTDLQASVAALLEEHRRKAPRVQARLVLELLDAQPAKPVAPKPVVTRSSVAWDEARTRIEVDPLGKLVDQGIATTRNRTHAAFRALGLEPAEVRAVVIEHDWLRVYYHDRPSQPSVPQTVPILDLEDTA